MRIEYFNKENTDLGLRMINCGYEDCVPNFVCRPHMRDYYLIHYIVKGYGFYEVGGHCFRVGAGEIFMIYPGQIITYYSPDVENPWSFCWIGFSGNEAPRYLQEAGLSDSYYVANCPPEFYSLIIQCLELVGGGKTTVSQLQLGAFILNALDLVSKRKPAKKNLPVHYVERAKNFIEFNYMNYISSKDVVQYLNIDRTYFYRLFKHHTGLSPEQYIIRLRIKKACELIEKGQYSFAEIADYVGIGDIYYFSKLFKKIKGVTPSQFRKSCEGETA